MKNQKTSQQQKTETTTSTFPQTPQQGSFPVRLQAAYSRYIPMLWLALAYILVSFILRITLLFFFGPTAHVPMGHYPGIIFLGTINDLVEVIYLLVPCAFYLLLAPQRFYNAKIGRLAMALLLGLTIFGMLYLCAVQYYFFKEYDARFNLVAVDYLIYPNEVFVNIWESYPVGRVLAVVAVLSSITLFYLWPTIKKSMETVTIFRRRLQVFFCHGILLSLALFGFSTHTLGHFSNRVSNELTANGLSSFFMAFHTNQLNYKQFYHVNNSQKMFSLLKKQLKSEGGQLSSAQFDNINRSFPSTDQGFGKLNVVVIVEESLGCEHVDSCGKGLDIDTAVAEKAHHLTPFLNSFFHQGLFFNRAYATGTRTVRGLEAISASFPPIPSESIMKRPGGEHIATWGKVMRENGYHTSFLYGGYGQFDNMNAYFRGNGFAISDRLDINNPIFTNIWGVSDQDLFRHARSYFDKLFKQGKPFFSIIMSTSNHSPFTFPSGLPGIPAKDGGRNAGVLYADRALHDFFTNARENPWYKNTLFVVVADHGARVYGEAQIPILSYEIPLFIFAPGHITPQQVQTPISQMDIAPTVLGLLGLPYKAPFFGRDVLAQNTASPILLFNHDHDVSLYRDKQLVVLGLRNTVNTYQYQLGTNEFHKIKDNQKLTDLATAYYQCAFELFQAHHYQ